MAFSMNFFRTKSEKEEKLDIIKSLTPDQFADLISGIDCVHVQDVGSKVKALKHDSRFSILKLAFDRELKSNRKTIGPPSGEDNTKMMNLIIMYYEGVLSAEVTPHVIRFSNGCEIWIANKYYSYGKLYKIENGIAYDSDEMTSDEVFVEVIYLERILKSDFYQIQGLPNLT